MIVSDKLGFIFHHVPKTAGMSLRTGLTAVDNTAFIDFPRKHPSAPDLKAIVGEYRWKNYFKFCFVRNPWDWYVSYYNFLLQNPQWLVWDSAWKHFDHEEFEAYRKHFMDEGFIYWMENFQWSFHGPIEGKSVTQLSQLDWITIDGGIEHTNIYKLEGIHESLEQVSSIIGRTITIPEINKSDREKYRAYYDDDTVEKVREMNKDLIRRAGYVF